MLTYVEDRRVDVPDRMIKPTTGMRFAAARGYAASLVAFDLETDKPLGCVAVSELGYPNARAWLEHHQQK